MAPPKPVTPKPAKPNVATPKAESSKAPLALSYKIGIEAEVLLTDRKRVTTYMTKRELAAEVCEHYNRLIQGDQKLLKNYVRTPSDSWRSDDSDENEFVTWQVIDDSSVKGDHKEQKELEFVSPILHANPTSNWQAEVLAFWEIVVLRFTIETNDSCGTHVHISPHGDQKWEVEHVKSVSKAIHWFEPAFEELLSAPRRGNFWAKSNYMDNDKLMHLTDIQDRLVKIDQCITIKDVALLMNPDKDRFWGWNFMGIFDVEGMGTIEFRRGDGITEPKQTLAYAELIMLFVHSAMKVNNARLKEFAMTITGLKEFVKAQTVPPTFIHYIDYLLGNRVGARLPIKFKPPKPSRVTRATRGNSQAPPSAPPSAPASPLPPPQTSTATRAASREKTPGPTLQSKEPTPGPTRRSNRIRGLSPEIEPIVPKSTTIKHKAPSSRRAAEPSEDSNSTNQHHFDTIIDEDESQEDSHAESPSKRRKIMQSTGSDEAHEPQSSPQEDPLLNKEELEESAPVSGTSSAFTTSPQPHSRSAELAEEESDSISDEQLDTASHFSNVEQEQQDEQLESASHSSKVEEEQQDEELDAVASFLSQHTEPAIEFEPAESNPPTPTLFQTIVEVQHHEELDIEVALPLQHTEAAVVSEPEEHITSIHSQDVKLETDAEAHPVVESPEEYDRMDIEELDQVDSFPHQHTEPETESEPEENDPSTSQDVGTESDAEAQAGVEYMEEDDRMDMDSVAGDEDMD